MKGKIYYIDLFTLVFRRLHICSSRVNTTEEWILDSSGVKNSKEEHWSPLIMLHARICDDVLSLHTSATAFVMRLD